MKTERRLALVVGLGETGGALRNVLLRHYDGNQIGGYDTNIEEFSLFPASEFDILNICYTYSEDFVRSVKCYQKLVRPKLTIIHSTVPIGTTKQFERTVHSPILGRHSQMERDLATYTKWIGGNLDLGKIASGFLMRAGLGCKLVPQASSTEALKLMCLAKYGLSIAFAKYQEKICKKIGMRYSDVMEWDCCYNMGVTERLRRPIIYKDSDFIGGHCVIPGTKLLNEQFENAMLMEVLKHGKDSGKDMGTSKRLSIRKDRRKR